MGVRTFLLISLLGAVAGGLDESWLSAMISAFALFLIALGYFNQMRTQTSKAHLGLTTEFAAGLIFCLGFVAHESPALSAVLGPLLSLILFSKKTLHDFTKSLKASELEAALLILLAGVVIIHFTPDETIDLWGIFNPRKFGYLVLALATLEFLSYILTKIFGAKTGEIVVGFFGGFVSSTAVTLSSAKQAQQNPESWRPLVSSALAAKVAALMELSLIVGWISAPLLLSIAAPITLAALLAAGSVFFLTRKKHSDLVELELQSPLDWKGVFRLSIVLAAILAITSLVEAWVGDQGTLILSFLTGLFELHGATVATATMFSNEQLRIEIAGQSILLAIIASLIAKIFIAWITSRGAFARALTFVYVPIIIAILLLSLPSKAQMGMGPPPMPLVTYGGSMSQGKGPSSVHQHRLNASTPIAKNGPDFYSMALTASSLHFGDNPILDDSGTIVPQNFSRFELGGHHSRQLEEGRNVTTRLSLGAASDAPFLKTNDIIFNASGAYSYPAKNEAQWMLTIFISNNSPLLNYVPIPGFIYLYRKDNFTGMFGVPFASMQWNLSPWFYSISVLGPSLNSEIAYGPKESLQYLMGFSWSQQSFLRYDRQEEKDRLFFSESKIFAGARTPLSPKISGELQGGYAFHRSVYEGPRIEKRDRGTLALDNAWFAQWNFRYIF